MEFFVLDHEPVRTGGGVQPAGQKEPDRLGVAPRRGEHVDQQPPVVGRQHRFFGQLALRSCDERLVVGVEQPRAVDYLVAQQSQEGWLPGDGGQPNLLATQQATLLLGDTSYATVMASPALGGPTPPPAPVPTIGGEGSDLAIAVHSCGIVSGSDRSLTCEAFVVRSRARSPGGCWQSVCR